MNKVCNDDCESIGAWQIITPEQLEQFPNLAAKGITRAARCKHKLFMKNTAGLEFYDSESGKCYCGSCIAQVLFSSCQGYKKKE